MATIDPGSANWREAEKNQCAIDKKKREYHHNYQPRSAVDQGKRCRHNIFSFQCKIFSIFHV